MEKYIEITTETKTIQTHRIPITNTPEDVAEFFSEFGDDYVFALNTLPVEWQLQYENEEVVVDDVKVVEGDSVTTIYNWTMG